MRHDQPFSIAVWPVQPPLATAAYTLPKSTVQAVVDAVRRLLGELGYTRTVVSVRTSEHPRACIANTIRVSPPNRRFLIDAETLAERTRSRREEGVVVSLRLSRATFVQFPGDRPGGKPEVFYDTFWPQVLLDPEPSRTIDHDTRPVVICSSWIAHERGPAAQRDVLIALAVRELACLIIGRPDETGHDGACILANDATTRESLQALGRAVARGGPVVCEQCVERLHDEH